MSELTHMLVAMRFAADKHRDQRRKDDGASPYINHPIEVADLVARVGGVEDVATLIAAVLHDTIEDTQTRADEITALFGSEVCGIVLEVSDDKSLPKATRKNLQIEHAPNLSPKAKLVKLADKIANVRSVTENPPADWPTSRRLEYLDWTERVVAGLRGINPPLESLYDQTLTGRESIGA